MADSLYQQLLAQALSQGGTDSNGLERSYYDLAGIPGFSNNARANPIYNNDHNITGFLTNDPNNAENNLEINANGVTSYKPRGTTFTDILEMAGPLLGATGAGMFSEIMNAGNAAAAGLASAADAGIGLGGGLDILEGGLSGVPELAGNLGAIEGAIPGLEGLYSAVPESVLPPDIESLSSVVDGGNQLGNEWNKFLQQAAEGGNQLPNEWGKFLQQQNLAQSGVDLLPTNAPFIDTTSMVDGVDQLQNEWNKFNQQQELAQAGTDLLPTNLPTIDTTANPWLKNLLTPQNLSKLATALKGAISPGSSGSTSGTSSGRSGVGGLPLHEANNTPGLVMGQKAPVKVAEDETARPVMLALPEQPKFKFDNYLPLLAQNLKQG